MQFVPVDTIICFRASCPLVIAVIEYFYLDRELPSGRSWLSLLGKPFCCLSITTCGSKGNQETCYSASIACAFHSARWLVQVLAGCLEVTGKAAKIEKQAVVVLV